MKVALDDVDHYRRAVERHFRNAREGKTTVASATNHLNVSMANLQAKIEDLRDLEAGQRALGDTTFQKRFYEREDAYEAAIDMIAVDPLFKDAGLSFITRPATTTTTTMDPTAAMPPPAMWASAALKMSQQMSQSTFDVTKTVTPMFEGAKGRPYNTFKQQWTAATTKMSNMGWVKADFIRELRKVLTGTALSLISGFQDNDLDYDQAMLLLEHNYLDEVEAMSELMERMAVVDKKLPTVPKMGFWLQQIHALDHLEKQLKEKEVSMLE